MKTLLRTRVPSGRGGQGRTKKTRRQRMPWHGRLGYIAPSFSEIPPRLEKTKNNSKTALQPKPDVHNPSGYVHAYTEKK